MSVQNVLTAIVDENRRNLVVVEGGKNKFWWISFKASNDTAGIILSFNEIKKGGTDLWNTL